MKYTLLFLILSQAACVSAFKFAEKRPGITTYQDSELYSLSRKYEKSHARQWADWDKNYVSDDVILVEIVKQPLYTKP